MSVLTPIAKRIAATAWMKSAMDDDEAARVFREKPALPFYVGIALILISYVIGWPAVAVLGLMAYHMREPLVLAVGGPLVYGLSHLVFLAGLVLAGKRYAISLAHWASRKAFEKLGGWR